MLNLFSNSLFKYASTSAPRYLLRLCILNKLFKKYIRGENKSFLEVGPGLGDISIFLSNQSAMSHGLVIDQSEKSIELIRSRLKSAKNIKILCSDIRSIKADIFDYVLSFEVLEHIDNDIDFMQDIFRRVAPSGFWFISVPAYMKKWQEQDVFSGHVRRYERREILDKLSIAGFHVVELIDYGFPLTSLMRPFRDQFYKSNEARSQLEKTLDSGVEKKVLIDKNPWLMLGLLTPFVFLQYIFSWLRQGDGFVVVAQKNA